MNAVVKLSLRLKYPATDGRTSNKMSLLTPQRRGLLSAACSNASRRLLAGCRRLHVDCSGHANAVLRCNEQKCVINNNYRSKRATSSHSANGYRAPLGPSAVREWALKCKPRLNSQNRYCTVVAVSSSSNTNSISSNMVECSLHLSSKLVTSKVINPLKPSGYYTYHLL
jgi:hypothetical protein